MINVPRLCVWSGLVGGMLMFLGLWPLMGFIPPPRPSADAFEIAALYRAHPLGIIAGCALLIAAEGLLLPFFAVISRHMEQMEPAGAPLAKIQLGLAIVAVCVPGTIAATLWMTAAFRPERPPEIIQLLNDLGWILLLVPVVSGMLQQFALGIAILNDRSTTPIFPRWFAFFNFWVGMAFLPGALLGFFKTGPFAWNGLLCFWLGLGAFGAWFVVAVPLLLKASRLSDGAAVGVDARR